MTDRIKDPRSNVSGRVGTAPHVLPSFDSYAQQVYAWAFRVLGRHHDALDVVQDVFLKWNEQCRRDPPRCPRGWLRVVTVNRALDMRRRDSSVAAATNELRSSPAEERGLDAVERIDLRDALQGALEELTDMQRSVLVAKVFDEQTFREIADELDLGIPTVKTHYLRAVRALRNQLQPEWESALDD